MMGRVRRWLWRTGRDRRWISGDAERSAHEDVVRERLMATPTDEAAAGEAPQDDTSDEPRASDTTAGHPTAGDPTAGTD